MGMKVFCTGISGTKKKEYLTKMVEEANKKHDSKYVKVYNLGDMMFEIFKRYFNMNVDKDNILNIREDLRKTAISNIFGQ